MNAFTSGKSPTERTTGTTTVGIVAEGGAVLAADRRASLGGRFVSNRDVRKIERVHPTAGLTISGSVGAAQSFVRSLRAEASLYETRRGEPMPMEALSMAASHAIRGLPVQPVLAGVDHTGPHLYTLDGAGGLMEDAYAATGSGMQLAYGVLEGGADEGLSLDAAADLAVHAVLTASERDTASGDGATVARITDEGVSTGKVQ